MVRPYLRLALPLLLIALFAPASSAQEATVGEVLSLRGAVTVERAGSRSRLVLGSTIMRSDRIATGGDGRIKIRFIDGTVVAIGSGSEIVAAEMAVGSDGARRQGFMSMITGFIRATVAPGSPSSRFDVQAATAIASVRSTEFMVEASPTTTGVFLGAGTIDVTSLQPGPIATVTLHPGEGTDVAVGTAPTQPKAWGSARVERLRERTELP